MLLFNNVGSSTIATVAYDENEQKLWLRFTNHSEDLYEYHGIDKQVVSDLLGADSKGKFFHENIRDKFEFEKVEEE